MNRKPIVFGRFDRQIRDQRVPLPPRAFAIETIDEEIDRIEGNAPADYFRMISNEDVSE